MIFHIHPNIITLFRSKLIDGTYCNLGFQHMMRLSRRDIIDFRIPVISIPAIRIPSNPSDMPPLLLNFQLMFNFSWGALTHLQKEVSLKNIPPRVIFSWIFQFEQYWKKRLTLMKFDWISPDSDNHFRKISRKQNLQINS